MSEIVVALTRNKIILIIDVQERAKAISQANGRDQEFRQDENSVGGSLVGLEALRAYKHRRQVYV